MLRDVARNKSDRSRARRHGAPCSWKITKEHFTKVQALATKFSS